MMRASASSCEVRRQCLVILSKKTSTQSSPGSKRDLLDDESLRKLVQRTPQLLSYSIEENLEPTLTFYEECLGVNVARTMILADPRVFSASLENRLKPRLVDALQAGITIDHGAITRMAKYTDEGWTKSIVYQSRMSLAYQSRTPASLG
jgi:hypothetical protein